MQFEGNLLSKGPQQPLKRVSTLLLNFIEGAPETKLQCVCGLLSKCPYRNCNVQGLWFQRGPNSNCNLKVICFQRGPHQPLKRVSTLLLNFMEGALKKL